MRDFADALAELRRRVVDAHSYLRVDDARGRMGELEQEASRPDLWDDQDEARKVNEELARLRDDVTIVDGLDERLSDLETLHELAREEQDESVESEIDAGIADLGGELDQLELRALFTGEHDERDAICEVHSGAGGTDAQDWTDMLLRMYTRWAEKRRFSVELDETQPGTEAGITSATFIVKGRYAYGLLSGEKGVHRLIRISPFDANARRQTAFASFDAVPALEQAEEPDIDPERPAHRHVPFVGSGRAARQRHRLGDPHHAPADGRRRVVPERALADPEPREGDADPRGAPRGATARGATGRARQAVGRQEGRRVRESDPHVHARAVPAGEGRAHALTRPATSTRCSTATSTRSSRRSCSGAAAVPVTNLSSSWQFRAIRRSRRGSCYPPQDPGDSQLHETLFDADLVMVPR